MFHCIGGGCCGSIWTSDDSPTLVTKCEDGNRGRTVQNDQTMHRRILAASTNSNSGLPVSIPMSYEVIEEDNKWWQQHLERFPNGRSACRAYFQERIPVVPAPIRNLLIERYCPEAIQAAAKASRENEDCLIRVYAGRRRRISGKPSRFFNLRNYGLHIDQMIDLGLDTTTIAQTLAVALAHCYWRAKVDANDVEFALAPATKPADPSIRCFNIAGSEHEHEHELLIWMLDYDCVREMSHDQNGVEQAVQAFYRNDPYFPRPHSYGHTESDLRLWKVFKTQFLTASKDILGGFGAGLPEKWVKQVEDEGRRRAELA
jgi:hypothetical protein